MCRVPDPVVAEPPRAASDSTARAGNRAQDRIASRRGRRSTILGDASPDSRRTGYSARKTLLGGAGS